MNGVRLLEMSMGEIWVQAAFGACSAEETEMGNASTIGTAKPRDGFRKRQLLNHGIQPAFVGRFQRECVRKHNPDVVVACQVIYMPVHLLAACLMPSEPAGEISPGAPAICVIAGSEEKLALGPDRNPNRADHVNDNHIQP